VRFGPDEAGQYEELIVKGIKKNCADIYEAYYGETITVELKSPVGKQFPVESVRGRFLFTLIETYSKKSTEEID
jgi:hypothetical protein